VGFTAHDDGSTSIDIYDDELTKSILYNCKSNILLVLSPFHLSILGRFLGKMGLEFLASVRIDEALSKQFDDLRAFVRYGSTSSLWPIYAGTQENLPKWVSASLTRPQQVVVSARFLAERAQHLGAK
jgi:hypothetical protein